MHVRVAMHACLSGDACVFEHSGLRHIATSTIDNLASYLHIKIMILTCVVIAICTHVSILAYLPYTASIPHVLTYIIILYVCD